MIQLTLRQFRTSGVAALGALAVVAVIVTVTGLALYHLYDTTVANCAAYGDCASAKQSFLNTDGALQNSLQLLMFAVPALIGMFWGAPLIAHELETGTFRLAWTQSVTRRRWLAVKLGLVGLASMAAAGLVSLMVTWWGSPFDQLRMDRITPGVFDQRGIVAIGYAAFAFALGVTSGVMLRRTLPAMAVTLVAFVGVRVAVLDWVRPHLVAPAHGSAPLAVDLLAGPAGGQVTAAAPSIPNGWVISYQLVDQAGHAITATALQQFLTTCLVMAGSGTGQEPGPVMKQAIQDCTAQLFAKFHDAVTYQPGSHFWLLQGAETALFLALALAVAGVCFWWVRRRLA